MARAFALLCSLVFFLIGLVGLVIVIGADATHQVAGAAQGNFGPLTLHLTWPREILDLVLLAAFGYVGLFAPGRVGRVVMAVAGAVLLLLGIAGVVIGDDAAASKGFAGLHFPVLINLLDIIVGVLALLSALGPTADEDAPSR